MYIARDVLCNQTSLVEDHFPDLYEHIPCPEPEWTETEVDGVMGFECVNCGYETEFDDDECDCSLPEVFQWFAVTSWLAGQLQSIGQPVLDNEYGYWWGRTCCGQGIELDGTFQRISRKFED